MTDDRPEVLYHEAMRRTQAIVGGNIKARGYTEGRTYQELMSRHACKLIEEAAEFSRETWQPLPLRLTFRFVRWLAGRYFDNAGVWAGAKNTRLRTSLDLSREFIRETHRRMELADVVVVALSTAEIITNESTKIPFVVVEAALRKSGKDISRGVRGT